MAASVRFKIPDEEEVTALSSPAHYYPLRSLESRSKVQASVGSTRSQSGPQKGRIKLQSKKGLKQRKKRVKTRKCGDISVQSTRRRVTIRPSLIRQQEFTIPSLRDSSPTKVVIKTNPLFSSTSPQSQQDTPPASELGVAEQAVFYGQRGKIRKTKEHEMINAIIDLTNHSKYSAAKGKKTTTLFQKIRNLRSRKGKSRISRLWGSSLSSDNHQLYQMLTQI